MSIKISTGALHVKNGGSYDTLDVFRGYAEVDDALDDQSENPVQNKVVDGAIKTKADLTDLAPAYSASGTYVVGAYVTYNGNIYRCTTAITTAEAWTAAHWTQVAIGDELSNTKADLSQIEIITPEQFGAVGDGVTDDTQAIQDACDAGYAVYFASEKTYLVTDTVIIDHNCYLFGGDDAVVNVMTPIANGEDGIRISGTLKKTTTLTTDYKSSGNTDNSGNRFTFADMTGINIGDVIVIEATDQYYSYDRQYYYLGATLLVSDIYEGHIYTTCSMPYDIENTQNVSVTIYDAPEVIINSLNFVSDISERERMYYRYCVVLSHCKNSIVSNCNMTQFDMGLGIDHCVNTLADNINLSKSKYDNVALDSDGYGISIISASDTIVRRLFAICSQACITLTGQVPCINTYIYDSNINSECRGVGIGLHANSYNLVIEDCVLGGLSLYGTANINRCRFIRNNRPGSEDTGITLRGSHNPDWARFRITNCVLDGEGSGQNSITITRTSPQTPVQAFQNVFGRVEIDDCIGGKLIINPTITGDITNNIIKYICLKNWQNCYEVYRTQEHSIEYFEINNTSFIHPYWMNRHTDAMYLKNIGELRYKSNVPKIDYLFADIQKNGGSFVLPEGINIVCSSDDSNAHYVVCGKNLASNIVDDYQIGAISGNVGDIVTRTPNANFSNALSRSESGNLVFTQPNNTTSAYVYPICMCYAESRSTARITCTFKNIGNTAGQAWRVWIIAVDCETGLITVKQNGGKATASEQGETSSMVYSANKNSLFMCYIGTSTAVKNSVTEFVDYVVNINTNDFLEDVFNAPYDGNSITGDGTLTSVAGKNNIMIHSGSAYDVEFKVDFANTPL